MLTSTTLSASRPSPSNLCNLPDPCLARGKGAHARRGRGAQPGNFNALRHGYYARHKPPHVNKAYARLENHLEKKLTGLDIIVETTSGLVDLSWQLGDAFDIALQTSNPKVYKPIFNAMLKIANRVANFATLAYRLTFQQRTLKACAENASATLAIAWRPRQPKPRSLWNEPYYTPIPIGNPPPPVYLPLTFDTSPFVPVFLQNPDTLSTYCGLPACPVSFLNDRHWHSLQLLIADQVAENHEYAAALAALDPSKKRRKSRAVPWPERFLLDGILWKLATACPWHDLPKPYPSRRCQKLYQSLHKSGRMLHIFNILHSDLHAYGDSDLLKMALNGEYQVFGSRILYIPYGKHTWQGLVALLLLQCTHHANLVYARTHPRPSLDPRLPGIPSCSADLSDYIPPVPPPGVLTVPPPINHPALAYFPLSKSTKSRRRPKRHPVRTSGRCWDGVSAVCHPPEGHPVRTSGRCRDGVSVVCHPERSEGSPGWREAKTTSPHSRGRKDLPAYQTRPAPYRVKRPPCQPKEIRPFTDFYGNSIDGNLDY